MVTEEGRGREGDQFAPKLFCLRCRTSVPIFSSFHGCRFYSWQRRRRSRGEGSRTERRREGEERWSKKRMPRPHSSPSPPLPFSLLPSKSTNLPSFSSSALSPLSDSSFFPFRPNHRQSRSRNYHSAFRNLSSRCTPKNWKTLWMNRKIAEPPFLLLCTG